MPTDNRIRSRMLTATGLLALVGVLLPGGCATNENASEVEISQFSGPDPSLTGAGVNTSAGSAAPRTVYAPVRSAPREPEILVIEPMETSAFVGEPEESEAVTVESGVAVYDAKVGDINGKPIIASRFLEDLMPRLRAIAVDADPQNRGPWRREAGEIIARKLEGVIRDEVLYREARARIPEITPQGLAMFVERMRENVRRQAGGSQRLAERRIQEEENKTMEQFLAEVEKQAVIKEILDIAAEDYPPVTWLDIQNEYQRRYEFFNPDPKAYFRIITTPDAESAENVKSALEGGASFEELASDRELNTFKPGAGGLFQEEGTTFEGNFAEARVIAIDDLNKAIVALDEGEWAGPIERTGGRQSFVYLERIEQESSSLEDPEVQIRIERYLNQVRSEEAVQNYVNRLKERANLGPERFSDLVVELLRVAETRVFGDETISSRS